MIEKNTHVSPELVVFCFEHTGLYSLSLALYLEERNLHYAMVAPLEFEDFYDYLFYFYYYVSAYPELT